MKYIKPTKEQFEDYVRIRDSGVTNMWAINVVCALSNTHLTERNCLYIMQNFIQLADEYKVKV